MLNRAILLILLCFSYTTTQSKWETVYFCFKEYCNPRKDMKMIPAEESSIKNIIFDLNGVLFKTSKKIYLKKAHFLFTYALQRLMKRESFNIRKFFEDSIKDIPHEFPYEPDVIAYHEEEPLLPILNDWQCGRDIHPVALEHLKKRKASRADKRFLRSIYKTLFSPQDAAKARIEISIGIQILRDLKDAGYNLYVLSNWDAQSFPAFRDLFADIFDLFDGIMISGDEGLVKPNIAFYNKCLKKFHLNAKESLFIDDQRINVKGAQKAGMHAFMFNAKNRKEIIQSLQQYGIIERDFVVTESA